MAKITNLSRARKTRAREQDRAKADANAARFGRTKVQKDAEAKSAEKLRKHLDQHRNEE